MSEHGMEALADDELAARLRHCCTYAELMAGLPQELVRHRERPDVAVQIAEILGR